MNNIIPYLAIFIIFTLRLLSITSISSALRTKFFVAYILGIVGLVAYLYYVQMFDIPYLSGAHLTTYTIILPEIIARIINIRRIKSKSVQIKTPILNSVFGFLGTGVFLLVTLVIVYFFFTEIASPKSETVFDVKYFLVRLNFLLVLVSFTVWTYLLATQKTSFYSEGLIYNGEVWKWSDFEFYSWSRRTFENDTKELSLASAKHVWLPAQIKVKIPLENKKQVDVLLKKNLEEL
jgi:hypothetical protein